MNCQTQGDQIFQRLVKREKMLPTLEIQFRGILFIMILKYNLNISNKIIEKDIKRIINQIYKLLPLRE